MGASRREILFSSAAAAAMGLSGCSYAGLLRPSVLRQVDPEMATLLNELPNLDEPNEAMIGRLFATGGASHASVGSDGVMRDKIRVLPDEYLWYPALIIMPRAGTLELDITNEDHRGHAAYLPHQGQRQLLRLPAGSRGVVQIRLEKPGLYWFGCPVENHATRGMLGYVVVKGEVPPEARLDRPPQDQPGNRRPPHAHH